ncbi:MAG TPA: class I SAM-dependent methyltransferase [Acidimicrobiales bacterium]|nr:class I SAM-dependent methyltransferase [Acidimicrobiales bacterium]
MTSLYGRDVALVHHLGFGSHADACAPGILRLLEPVRGGLVLELGCGSGALTRHLLAAGHRVVATDASPDMVHLTRASVTGAEDVRVLVLPDEPLPEAAAVVSVGHVLNYLPDEAAVERALVAVAGSLAPGGVLALDLCDLRYAEVRREAPPYARVEDDWAIFTSYEVPSPRRFVRRITTFLRAEDRSWRRDDERHENVLVDTSKVPGLLAAAGVPATVAHFFGEEPLPEGLVAVVGRR